MKKIIILLVTVIFTCHAHAQVTKTFLVTVRGNYIQSSSDNGTSSNINATFGKYLDAGISTGVFVSDKFAIGLGLDYYWSKEQRSSDLFINRFMQKERTEIKASGLVPYIFTGYYFKILNNLYFNVNLEVGVGKLETESESIVAGTTLYPDNSVVEGDEYTIYLRTSENSSKYDYFRSGIHPSINYFVTKHLGICLTIGQIEYSFIDWDTNNSNWVASFNPTYWSYGIKFKFDSTVE